MPFNPDFLSAVAKSDICSLYYSLCSDFPSRSEENKSSLAAKTIFAAAKESSFPLKKLAGPGSVYQVLGLPDGLKLNIIIQSGDCETDFSIQSTRVNERSTFAILCHDALASIGAQPEPPYPRPTCLSADEFIAIARRLAIWCSGSATLAG